MSEKTLSELATQHLLDARIRRAEAAEAYAAWAVDVPPQATTLDIYATGERLLSEYKAAREAVRKMEEQT